MINPKLFTWMATKFVIEDGARTAVQDIVNQYKEDFPKESMYMPLQSYQVGQLVRKIFPDIGRCKISVGGKRVWVYKDLGKSSHVNSNRNGSKNLKFLKIFSGVKLSISKANIISWISTSKSSF